jgi:hypothetical protein
MEITSTTVTEIDADFVTQWWHQFADVDTNVKQISIKIRLHL